LSQSSIDNYYFKGGSIYFLRADTTLRRTIPLSTDTTRITLDMTWASKDDLESPVATANGEDRWWENTDAPAVNAEMRKPEEH